MVEKISGDQLKQELDQYVIIDVRESDEVSNGFIENSQNILQTQCLDQIKHFLIY